jgi:hypothetical protein
MAVEEWLEGIPYDSRVSMRRSWCTDDLFDTTLPERKIVHENAGAGNTIGRLPRNESRLPLHWAPPKLARTMFVFHQKQIFVSAVSHQQRVVT